MHTVQEHSASACWLCNRTFHTRHTAAPGVIYLSMCTAAHDVEKPQVGRRLSCACQSRPQDPPGAACSRSAGGGPRPPRWRTGPLRSWWTPAASSRAPSASWGGAPCPRLEHSVQPYSSTISPCMHLLTAAQQAHVAQCCGGSEPLQQHLLCKSTSVGRAPPKMGWQPTSDGAVGAARTGMCCEQQARRQHGRSRCEALCGIGCRDAAAVGAVGHHRARCISHSAQVRTATTSHGTIILYGVYRHPLHRERTAPVGWVEMSSVG